MHVHVSRKPLSMLTVGKLTEFMNRHENKEFITHIAGQLLSESVTVLYTQPRQIASSGCNQCPS